VLHSDDIRSSVHETRGKRVAKIVNSKVRLKLGEMNSLFEPFFNSKSSLRAFDCSEKPIQNSCVFGARVAGSVPSDSLVWFVLLILFPVEDADRTPIHVQLRPLP
jgi:hypothetical protein